MIMSNLDKDNKVEDIVLDLDETRLDFPGRKENFMFDLGFIYFRECWESYKRKLIGEENFYPVKQCRKCGRYSDFYKFVNRFHHVFLLFFYLQRNFFFGTKTKYF